jgi:hypothetical protein
MRKRQRARTINFDKRFSRKKSPLHFGCLPKAVETLLYRARRFFAVLDLA